MDSAAESPIVSATSAISESAPSAPVPDFQLDDAAKAWIQEQQRLISAALGSDSDRSYGLIKAILDKSLSRNPDTTAMDTLIADLSVILGDEQATRALLTTVAQCFNDHAYLHGLREAVADPGHDGSELSNRIQELVALYGWSIARAVRVEGEDPLGWLTLERYVCRELVGQQWQVRVVLTLNDGGKLTIRDKPESLALLAEALLDSLNFIPGEVLKEVIPAKQVESLTAAYNDFISYFQQPEISSPAEEPREAVPEPG